jgi:general secretion pathway protein I
LSRLINPYPPSSDADAGFTLIEALVALAMLAISLAAIGGLAASSSRSGLYVERHLAQIETAQAIVAGMPDRKDLAAGIVSGELVGHSWSLDMAPIMSAIVDPKAASVWSPQQIVLRVQSPSGALLRFDTVRLIKRPSQ